MDNLTSIIPFGGALGRFPGAGIVLYSRVSSYGQAGIGKARLEAKTAPVVAEVLRLAPGRLRRIVRAVEEGKLSRPRPDRPRPRLIDAASYARDRGCIVVAADLSRLIRAEAYDRRKNAEAWPRPEEFDRLRELTFGVPLATLLDPESTERERLSRATRRTGTAGRPRAIDDELAARIFDALGPLCAGRRTPLAWERPLADVAAEFGVSVSAIVRASERPSPSGLTWREEGLKKAERLGLIEIDDDGSIVCLTDYAPARRGWWGKRGRPPKYAVRGSN